MRKSIQNYLYGKVRKLQFIWTISLNIPKSTVRNAKWERGDYFEVVR